MRIVFPAGREVSVRIFATLLDNRKASHPNPFGLARSDPARHGGASFIGSSTSVLNSALVADGEDLRRPDLPPLSVPAQANSAISQEP